jgi:hypothetical protein
MLDEARDAVRKVCSSDYFDIKTRKVTDLVKTVQCLYKEAAVRTVCP